MRTIASDYGTLLVGSVEDTFRECVAALRAAIVGRKEPITVGLAGGATPKAFYAWALRTNALPSPVWKHCLWLASDERYVPFAHEDSNFGNASRLLLLPLGVPAAAKIPWPVELPPRACVAAFNQAWNQRFGANKGFDVCFLGMGEDGHTASLYPGCPLIDSGLTENFGAVDWPGKGWRLTITQAGLAKCGRVIVLVNGASKNAALKAILQGPYDPKTHPSQIHKAYADRVTWLVDEAAAAGL